MLEQEQAQEVAEQPTEEVKAEETTPEVPQQEAPTEDKSDEKERDEKGRFKGVQSRIDELTRARREAERQAAYWREMAETKAQTQAEPEPKPTQDKFSTYDEYVEALTDWKASQAAEKVKRELAQTQAETANRQAQTAVTETWQQRQSEARKAIPDYDEVLGAAAEVYVAKHVEAALLDSARGPELAYHFAKNPQEVQRINGLSPIQAAMEIGRLEASLVKPQRISKAPEPVKPLASGKAGSANPVEMPMEDYMKWRQKQGVRWGR
jgi:hypothetical protein